MKREGHCPALVFPSFRPEPWEALAGPWSEGGGFSSPKISLVNGLGEAKAPADLHRLKEPSWLRAGSASISGGETLAKNKGFALTFEVRFRVLPLHGGRETFVPPCGVRQNHRGG